ncbi:MAG: UDP-3-O-(3-hydroxymyristoyl)glucosamine N-acyltransferase [Candidatus Omnitrophica bacterium]|nr:UDP-3-O-(3-hydroxymyristoyl)glucosamine N-acyltransferase [Candidatus Omnitrophota bacterium]
MRKTVAEIAKFIEGDVCGDDSTLIKGCAGLKEAQEGDLSFVANPKYIALAEQSKASAVIVPRELSIPGKTFIRTKNSSLAFSKAISLFLPENTNVIKGIHPTAIIAKDVVIGKDVAIGPYVVVEPGVVLGERSVIHAGCYLGLKAQIGSDCLIYPNVTVRETVTIGHRVIIHSGTVIGCDGFGYVMVDGKNHKIPQVGTVIIEDDVEIGACVTIDRARFDKTVVGQGTKIDNLVQIAHNVVVGENCIIVSQSGISGSVTIGNGAILAGQAGIAGHLTIGEGAIVSAKAGVSKSIAPHTQVTGYPARPIDKMMEVNAHVQLLPKYVKTIQDLKKRIDELEKKVAQKL